jgi:hypothetical protein
MGLLNSHVDKLDDDLELENENLDNENENENQEDNKQSKKTSNSFFKKKKKNKYLTEDDVAQKKRSIINKSIILITVFGIIIIILMAIYITTKKESERRAYIKAHPPKKEETVKLLENSDNLWKLQVDNQIKYLKGKMDKNFFDIKTLVKEENNNTIQAVNGLIENKVLAKVDSLQEQINEVKNQKIEILNEINKKNSDLLNKAKTYTLQKSLELQSKLFNLKPVSVSITKNEQNSVNNKMENNKKNKKITKEEKRKKWQKQYKKRVIEVEKEVSNLNIQTIPIDMEVQSQLKEKETPKKENVSYHLMTGFTKATLITGVSAPTFSTGVINPKPILLSVDGRGVIANDQHENIKDCLLIGKATGNMNTSRAEILITRISCSIPTDNPHIYKKIEAIGNPIGWIIGEDGKYGLRGRLVDSAGKVITRQIMIGFLQGVSQAFAPSAIMPMQTTTTSPLKNASNNIGSSVTSGISNAFSSLAEYYKKMLDGMYPYIDVMAGRKVTVLLKGFQDIKVTKYKKVDISQESEKNQEENYEIKIDYDNF